MGQACQPRTAPTESEFSDGDGFLDSTDPLETNIQHQSNRLQCDNRQTEKLLDKIAEKIIGDKSLYKDLSTPSASVTLKSKNQKQQPIHCVYKRPYNFLSGCEKGKIYKIFQHERDPSLIVVQKEVLQFFGIFLCFLESKPTEISKIICTKQNSLGVHCIEKYQNGRVIKFLIDDYILCQKESEKRASKGPIFTQPIKGIFMWPCILEKAWFKVKSNKRIQQNSPEEVFEKFLPLPLEKIELKLGINSKARQKIHELHYNFSKDKGYYCKSRSNPEHDLGLLKNQYFYIMETFKNKEKKIFFYVRNPCGFVQFRGTQITEQIRVLLEEKNINKISPGNFVLDEEEIIQQMSQITIIHHSPASKITPYKFQLENNDIFIGFDLKYKGHFNLSIAQSSKNNPSSEPKSFYPITYQVVRLADNKLLGGHDNREGCFGLKTAHLLDRFNQESVSGKYLIRIKKKHRDPVSNINLCLIGYCQQQIKFDISAQQELDQKWQDFMLAEGEKELLKKKNERGDRSAEIQHAVCWIGDIAYIYIKKVSRKESVTVEVNFPELMNLECISHPEIKRSESWQSYTVSDKLFIVFQKIDLTAETQIRQYYIEAY